MMFQMNLYIHSPVWSFTVYLPPCTRLSPWFGGFSCGAITDKEQTQNAEKYSLIKEP